MPNKILVTAPYFQPVVDDYRQLFAERRLELILPVVDERLTESELLDCIDGVVGVIAGDDQFTREVLTAATDLKVISKWGTGIDSIDQEAAAELGIAVRNTLGAFNEPVADQVMGYILSFARRIPWINSSMHHSDTWSKEPCMSLHGKTLGVIGVGNTGREAVRRAKSFGMKLLGNDIIELPATFIYETDIEMTDKVDLLKRADFVSLSCTLNPTSHHIIRIDELKAMKPTAVLINCARGPLIDEPALVDALQTRIIAGAALDVFEDEPLPETSALRQMDNVLLSPHNANSSAEHWLRIHETTIKHLFEELGL